MVIKNLSTRRITLRDEDGNIYIIPSLDELVLDDSLIEDNTFKRWLRWRLRDVYISPFVNIEKNGSAVDSKPTLNFIEGTNTTITTTAHADSIDVQIDAAADVDYGNLDNVPTTFPVAITKAGSAVGTRNKINFIEGSNVTLTVADNPGSARVDVTVTASGTLSVAWTDITGKPSTFAPSGHQSAHQSGGSDAISGLLDANAKTAIAKAGSTTGTRRKINFIEGSGVSITLSDDNAGEKVDVTIASTAGAPATATYITTQAESGLSAEKVLGTDVIIKGTAAAQPATSIAGRLYYITNAGDERLTRDTGSGWDNLTIDWDYVTAKPTTFAPTTHATAHQSGGGDAIKLDDLAAPDDNTDLDASASKHGLLPKLPNDSAKFLRGDGTWTVPTSNIRTLTDNFGSSSATLTTLASFAIDGTAYGIVADQSSLTFIFAGYYNNSGGSGRTVRLVLSFGGVPFWDDTTGTIATSSNKRAFRLMLNCDCHGSTQAWSGNVIIGNTSAPGSGVGVGRFSSNDLYNVALYGETTATLSADNLFEFKAQASVQDSGTTPRLMGMATMILVP